MEVEQKRGCDDVMESQENSFPPKQLFLWNSFPLESLFLFFTMMPVVSG